MVLRIRVTGLAPNGDVGLRVEQPGIGYATGGHPECAPDAPLREVNRDELHTLEWDPGPARPETVVVTVTACAPVGARTQRVIVQVPASTQAP